MKVTKATLKKLARRKELKHKKTMEFSGMVDALEQIEDTWTLTTPKDVDKFFSPSRNFLQREHCNRMLLMNCCYSVKFYHSSF